MKNHVVIKNLTIEDLCRVVNIVSELYKLSEKDEIFLLKAFISELSKE